jgi:hypothetical protein
VIVAVLLQMTKAKTNLGTMKGETANRIDPYRLRHQNTHTLDTIRFGRGVRRTTYQIYIISLAPFLGELYLHLIHSKTYGNKYRMLIFQKRSEGELWPIFLFCTVQAYAFPFDFRLPRWLITDVNSVLGLLHRVLVGDVVDVSEVHAASIFRVKVSYILSIDVCNY